MGAGDQPSDGQLVLLAKDGNLEAFNSLVDRYQNAIYSLCYRLLGVRESAEDATQEAFLAAYRALGRFEGGNVRSWLLRIGANEAHDELRRRKRRGFALPLGGNPDDPDGLPLDLPDRAPGAETLLLRREMGHDLEQLLLRLPFEQRQAVVLIDVYDMAYDEVARMTGSSLGTVKSRVHRGRERMRALIAGQPELFPRAARLEDRRP